ncbi:response regulator [Rubripirellula amarantea]|uniref:Uncharacterized protein n=1 Tax=Rubripirellula amarantea TaxID=2527999 RepID=A0A5C5WQE9_9BACT|nr:response regulator [Rubripirellula amarantea]MDA8743673.1 response regulator [Rubripirellula amarantea]TWT52379.1 hypothetical protein Pla22_00030 [Rubripirellula amarantea]
MSIRFTQSCPTCGRRVQIRASLVGYNVVCQHCSAEFVANSDGESGSSAPKSPENVLNVEPILADPLMARVEAALKRAADQSSPV